MQSTWMMVLTQMLGQLPVLLVYVGGLVWCAVMWRRAPTAAMLAIAGLAIMLITTLGQSAVASYVINNRGGARGTSIGQALVWINVGTSIIRAFGLALVIASVFAGRPRGVEVSGFEVQPPPLR